MADRYETAADLADDLKLWLAQAATTATVRPQPRRTAPGRRARAPRPRGRSQRSARFRLRGCRLFSIALARPARSRRAAGVDPFLEIADRGPGPRRDVRRWGCSMGRPGAASRRWSRPACLPRLAAHVKPVYVEAAADGTEGRLLAALGGEFPDLPAYRGLAETAAAIREGTRDAQGCQGADRARPVRAMAARPSGRCDSPSWSKRSASVTAAGCRRFVLVRDDFWMGITRFLGAVEVPLVEGSNSAAVELFNAEHAVRVLAELGRAHGRLADPSPPPGSAASQFLDRAVAELAGPGGRIIPVRLSLFAEMVKNRPWTPATLKDLGGIEGIGVTFLEETFSAAAAPPAHRAHRRAALAVLEALLPEPSSDLKGKLQGSRCCSRRPAMWAVTANSPS